MKTIRMISIGIVVAFLMVQMPGAQAQTANVVSDNFIGTSATLSWAPFNGACLTAGNGSGTIPACSGLSYYAGQTQTGLTSNKDTVGNGALRLTNGCPTGYANGGCYYSQNGAIISTTPFSANLGIQVTFTTYTYGGDNSGGHGADGIGFYLLNGADANNVVVAAANPSKTTNAWNLGSWGGSLGYSCSNVNAGYNGMTDAYMGLGMDEFGNFLNSSDNTATGDAATNSNGGNGVQYQPGRIGLRGYGNINLYALKAINSAATQSDVQALCQGGGSYTYNTGQTTTTTTYTYTSRGNTITYTGTLYTQVITGHGSNQVITYIPYIGTGTAYGQLSGNSYVQLTATTTTTPVTATVQLPDYAAIPNAFVNLPSTTPIANESATTRANATPIAYKLQITQDGLLSLWYSYNGGTYNPVLTNQSISASNGTMPGSFLFGFGGSTGGSDNVHEITCFQATPADQSASSAGVNVQQTGQVQTGTQVYLAYYHANNWWGELDAQNLVVDPTTGAVTIASVANWDASCVLTGGACPATGATGMTAQAPSQRTLLTWNGSAGVSLAWNNLSTTEQLWLNAGDTQGQNRLAYLTGDRSNEIDASGNGLFRGRSSVLADIIDSSPTWVGPPVSPYPALWKDLVYTSATMPENATGAATYTQYQTTNATRLNVVYEGANDGFLHGFRSGSYSSAGVYNNTTTPNDGLEMMAYMPQAILQTIHNSSNSALDYSSSHYAHNFFVDATPGAGDLFYSSGWHTWLVGGLGAGGNAIYALDITNPTSFSPSKVIGEWSTATTTSTTTTLACSGDTSTILCGKDLGQTYGTPQIRRLHNGQWAIIFGNGLNSITGHAAIYVMTISATGAPSTVYFLDTGVGTTLKPDGITYVTPVDLDGDHITDEVYAGDVYGNVWRFDLTSSTPGNWKVFTYGSTGPTPLFTTPTTSSQVTTNGVTTTVTTNQPITTQLVALSVSPSITGQPRVLLEFGTGAVTPQTTASAIQYAPGQQTLYGIWDWDMGQSATPGSSYAGLSGSSAPTTANPITVSKLQQQTVTSTTSATQSGSGQGYRSVSTSSICFVGSSCSTLNSNGTTTVAAGTQFGWYMNLPGFAGVTAVGGSNQTEQVVYSAIESEGAFLVNTTIPSNNSPLTCSLQGAQGWTMALNPATGGAFSSSFFGNTGGGYTTVGGGVVSGIALNATGSPSVVIANTLPFLVSQTASGLGAVNQIYPPPGSKGGRLTWIELH